MFAYQVRERFSDMKSLVVFTEGFPVLGVTEEAFIRPELFIGTEVFRRVVVVPPIKGKNNLIEYSHIHVDESYADVDVANVSKWKILLRPRLWKDCLSDRLNVRRHLEYERFETWLDGFLEDNGFDSNNTILYAFWLAREAEFVGRYAKEHDMVAVARAHRFDIFEMTDTKFRRDALYGLRLIYPCSGDGANALRSRYPELADRIHVSYLGVEKPNVSTMNPMPNDDKTITFFSCHNLIRRKRGLFCAKCLAALAKAHPELRFRWILVGDGEERMEIEALMARLPRNIRFDLCGRLTNDKVHEIYSTEPIDFAILLSDSEGLAVMDQEAMSYGIPVIGTDVGGTRECINSENGVLLAADVTTDMVVSAVEAVLPRRVVMRISAFRTYQEKFIASKNRREFFEGLGA